MGTSIGFMLAFGGVVFLMFLVLTVPVAQSSGQKRLLKARLKQISSEKSSNVSRLIADAKLKKMSPIARNLETVSFFAPIRSLILHAGLTQSVLSILGQMALASLTAVLFLVLLGQLDGFGVVVIPLIAFLPIVRLVVIRNKRLAEIERQLPEALDMMKRALQVGHPFVKTLQVVAEDMGGPLGNEFGLAYVDINYGASVESALNALVERVPSLSLAALVTTVTIQRESGGSLSETLEKISGTIRGRFQFQRLLRTLTSESRLSAWLLGLSPFVLFVLMYVIHPGSMSKLTHTPQGHDLILKGLAGIAVGCFWMRNILQGVNK